MTVSAELIAELRRMVNEPSATTYSDATIETYIARYPVMDANGEEPYSVDYTTTPPTSSENDDWTDTFDLHRAAADIWQEKAAVLSVDYNLTADGATLNRGQVFDQYMRQVKFHLSRRKPLLVRHHPVPKIESLESLQTASEPDYE